MLRSRKRRRHVRVKMTISARGTNQTMLTKGNQMRSIISDRSKAEGPRASLLGRATLDPHRTGFSQPEQQHSADSVHPHSTTHTETALNEKNAAKEII